MSLSSVIYVAVMWGTGLSGGFVSADVSLLKVNYPALISRADLIYEKPADRSEAGIPVGNGRMGTLLWTTPTALKMQINRVDIFANGSATGSFPQRHSDYCGGAGFVDIEFVDYGDAVFPDDHTRQRLSCYDGLATINGKDVQVQALAWHEQDVIVLQITDRRPRPGTISVNLRMLRNAEVRTASHTARSALDSSGQVITLAQQFEEDGYYCGSAVAVGVSGRDLQIRQSHEGELCLVVQPGQGSFIVLIASAAGFDRDEDLTEAASRQLDEAAQSQYDRLLASNKAWWHDFWTRSFVHLHSDDGVADMIEVHYTYYLYIMASTSRGKYPAKFNGMLWTTGGDTRQWGGQYWGANQSCLYNNALFAANQTELLNPHFDMYSAIAESCTLAAQQQWGSRGIFIPETVAFDGLAKLPDPVASEMQALYLLQKPWEQRSEQFLAYAHTRIPHSSRWNWKSNGSWQDGRWICPERGSGPFGPVTHIFSRGAKIAYQYWLRYEYTQDKDWLGSRAYPMIKGVAEFYRNYPKLKKESDGKYHIYHVNSNESIWGGKDTDEEIASMRAIFSVAVKASEILGLDAQMRTLWQEVLDNLAPLPVSTMSDTASSRENNTPSEPYWIRAMPPIVRGTGTGRPDGNTMPMWFFDLCTLENDDRETMKIACATYDGYVRRGVNEETRIGVLSKIGLTAAMMGRADHVRNMLPNQLSFPDRAPVMANRLDQREGRQTTSAQRLGSAADVLHTALVQSVSPGPGRPSIIRVFPAWPAEWNASFALLCRGGFLVSSSMQKGRIEFVEILSQHGGVCRMRNPWDGHKVSLFRDGRRSESLSGALLEFDTVKRQDIVVLPAGSTPDQFTKKLKQKTVP